MRMKSRRDRQEQKLRIACLELDEKLKAEQLKGLEQKNKVYYIITLGGFISTIATGIGTLAFKLLSK